MNIHIRMHVFMMYVYVHKHSLVLKHLKKSWWQRQWDFTEKWSTCQYMNGIHLHDTLFHIDMHKPRHPKYTERIWHIRSDHDDSLKKFTKLKIQLPHWHSSSDGLRLAFFLGHLAWPKKVMIVKADLFGWPNMFSRLPRIHRCICSRSSLRHCRRHSWRLGHSQRPLCIHPVAVVDSYTHRLQIKRTSKYQNYNFYFLCPSLCLFLWLSSPMLNSELLRRKMLSQIKIQLSI